MTNAELSFQSAVRELGCIVCRLSMNARGTPCSIHHILDKANRRKGEMFVLGLCRLHHQGGCNNALYVSRHPWRKAFIQRYGTEEFLLEQTRKLLQQVKAA